MARALVQAFASCQLDYCDSFLASIAEVHFWHLQSVQNVAAHIYNHIVLVLDTLHWLPICQQVIFKIAVLVLQDKTLCYFVDLCVPAAPTDDHHQ